MPTNEYGQPTDSKGNVLTQSQLIEAEVKELLDKCYSDRPADGHWYIMEHHIPYIAKFVLKHRHDVYFQAFKDGLVQGRKEGQAMLDSSEEE